ncbi:MAG: Dabb family protein [Planctomycetota bacterium]|nr:MAG: Dabb family protein [Planctomycetota bacterium]
MIIHTVYFWLKSDLTAEQQETFRRGIMMLGNIDSASAVWIGQPASTEARAVVDHSYDYALICMFQSVADHDAYQADPQHQVFIDQCRDLWSKVQVYDCDAGAAG